MIANEAFRTSPQTRSQPAPGTVADWCACDPPWALKRAPDSLVDVSCAIALPPFCASRGQRLAAASETHHPPPGAAPSASRDLRHERPSDLARPRLDRIPLAEVAGGQHLLGCGHQADQPLG